LISGTPRNFRADRPDRYLEVAVEGAQPFWFKLPNERRQMVLLKFVARNTRGGGRSPLAVVDSLNALAAVVGVCWFHRIFRLEVPPPWAELDSAMLRARLMVEGDFDPSVVPVPKLERGEGESADDFGDRVHEAHRYSQEDQLDAARERAEQEAADAVLRAYGDDVLEDLDDEEMGGRNLIGTLFGGIVKKIGSNFIPDAEVDGIVGNGRRAKRGVASSD
jgi:hypothetical protein